ncbi:LLM class flavin-dependent oxidoreductase [soil metagenome]
MSHPLRIGLKLAQQIYPLDVLRAVWRIADDAGFDHCWGFDHLIALGDDSSAPVYDGWVVLGAMAEATKRTRLGLIVTGNLYRHPGLLAKMGVTVDHLSGGRLEMGIGAAWNEPEFAQQGLPFPSVAERIRRLDESCTVMKLLWADGRATFEGRYYQLRDAIAEPKPVQRPHPPIWIGGAGPKRTLRVVARHADVWNSNASSMEETLRLSGVLDEHCAAVRRDPAAVRRSVQVRWQGRDETAAPLETYARAGFTELVIMLGGADPRRAAEEVAAALPTLRAIG